MRFLALLFAAFLICAAPLSGQREEDDPYELKLVQANLRMKSTNPGLDIPSLVKSLQRLGDGVSIALLKILDEQDLRNPTNVENFLPLIRESFSYPSIISIDVNKKPQVTLFLLAYLQRNVSDPRTRRDIRQTIQYVKQKTAG